MYAFILILALPEKDFMPWSSIVKECIRFNKEMPPSIIELLYGEIDRSLWVSQ